MRFWWLVGSKKCQVTLDILPYACELCMIINKIFYDLIWGFWVLKYILYDDTIFTYNNGLLFTYIYRILLFTYTYIYYSSPTYKDSMILFTIHLYGILLFTRIYYSSLTYMYCIILFTYTYLCYYSHIRTVFTIHLYA